jgi:hypothetical protein
MDTLTESVLPFRSLPKADPRTPWDAGKARERIRRWATRNGEVNVEQYARAFLFVDGPKDNLSSYKFPIADVIDGRLKVVPRALSAANAVLGGARGGADLSSDDAEKLKALVARHRGQMEESDPEPDLARLEEAAKTLREQDEGPQNEAGLTVAGTFQAIEQGGRKFAKDEARFVEKSPEAAVVCGACRFYLRDETGEIGQCQVVDGDIPWFSHSGLFISAVDEAEAAFGAAREPAEEPTDEAYEGEEERKAK